MRALQRLAPLLACACAQLLAGCVSSPAGAPDDIRAPADAAPAQSVAAEPAAAVQTHTIDGVSVSAWLVPDDEAERRYGVNLADKGLQAVWLRAENGTTKVLWLLAAYVDPDYFTADEAAYLFRFGMSGEELERLRQRFRDLSMRARLEPGLTYQGHVLVPRSEGGRYVEVTINGRAEVRRFGFPLRTPDGHFDFEDLDPAAIYPGFARPDLDEQQLRARLEELPCCATDKSGEKAGDPLNVVLVGKPSQVMAALSQSGWSFTHRIDWTTIRREISAAVAGSRYPNAPVSDLYVFDRPQDLAFQRARFTLSQRNHMRLWLAPYTFKGLSVWVGQVSRDIGIKVTAKSSTLTTHIIDPLVDEARQYVLESLLIRHRIEAFTFVPGAPVATREDPARNLTDDPYVTDGMRLVVLVAEEPVRTEQIRNLGWGRVGEGPVAIGQSEQADTPLPVAPPQPVGERDGGQ